MNIEIKKGDHVFIPGVVQREPEGEFVYVEYKCGSRRSGLEYFRQADVSELLILHPENGIKNTENKPKYDPCRKFRKGDIVEVKEDIDGRNLHAFTTGLTLGKLYTVEEDEKDCKLKIKNDDGNGIYAFVHFKLVTPVEELEPYSVKLRQELTADDTYPYCAVVDDDGNEAARFYSELYEAGKARAAAEAECARLNAEYRKEQK